MNDMLKIGRPLPPPTMTRQEAIAALTGPGQPFELELLEIGGTHKRCFKTGPATLRTLFNETTSQDTFIVYETERLTFLQAYAAASKIAHVLKSRYKVAKGDRVAISMRNYPEWVLAFMAATSIGAIAVAMNALWRPEELEYGLVDSGAKVLFADQERLDRLAKGGITVSADVIAVRPKGPHATAMDLSLLLLQIRDAAMPEVEVVPEDGAIIFYTSGSTGRPKGVLSTHRNVVTALMSWELDAAAATLAAGISPPNLPDQAATLLAVPLFHVTGSHAAYLMCYRAQRKMVCMFKWDPQVAAALIEQEKISSFIAPAAITGDLVRVARETDRDLSTLLTVGGGGAPRAPEQVRQIGSSFANALPGTGWGMTETNAIGAGISGQDYLRRPNSSGRCSAVLDLKVCDPRGLVLPVGERGELMVRGTSVFRGYWNRPEVDLEVFSDDWFRTGDVAYLDAEGYLFIVDRIKDVIIRGGENIGCGQVEAALLMHSGVWEAAVYAVPDDRLGEEVGATIFGSGLIDLDDLRAFLNQNLAKFEVPRYITVSPDPLPRTASGKILKRDLRDRAVERLKAFAPSDLP